MTGQHDEPPVPGDRPPRRLLERAPGERYAASRVAAASRSASTAGSTARAAAYGGIAGVAGVGVHVFAAQVLLWVGMLLLVATTIGYVVGLGVRVGASAGPRAPMPAVRRGLGAGIAVLAVVVALGIAWLASGRYLDPLDFAGQVYGFTVPLQLAGAAAGALAGTR